jgi:uncharacterized membrane protein YkvA (DUF1232 family)
MRPDEWLARIRPAAADILAQGRKIAQLVDAAGRIAARARDRHPAFARLADDLDTAFRLLKAYGQGRYREVPYRSMLALAAGLLYLVSPLDAIPDLLVTLGFIDDLAVLTLVIGQIRHDLVRFRDWERQRSETGGPPRALPHPTDAPPD